MVVLVEAQVPLPPLVGLVVVVSVQSITVRTATDSVRELVALVAVSS
jgi:hypothetical protein